LGVLASLAAVVTGLTAVLVIALAGAHAVSAGTLPAGRYPVEVSAPATGVPLAFQAGVGSSNTLPAGTYPAPAPAKGVPLVFPAGVRSNNIAASAQDLVCTPPEQSFKSSANGLYVAAELGYGPYFPVLHGYGMLRARAEHVGPWEKFQFCEDKATKAWSIFSNANNRWVSTEVDRRGGSKGMLRARAETVGPWERYSIHCSGQPYPKGTFVIYARANNKWVAAELGYTGAEKGMLRARADVPGAWEHFFGFPTCT
jgi:hypothetical protein